MYKKITPKEFFDIRSKENNWQLLDVREKEEIEIAKLPDSIFIPMNDVKSRIEELNKEKPIAVICRSGIRSAEMPSNNLVIYTFMKWQDYSVLINYQ